MKHGSEYASKVKRFYRQLLKQFGKPEIPAPTDPIDQLILGILSSCTTDQKAAAVYRRLREQTVDLNELRVTPAMELAEMIGTGVPLAREKAQRIVDALNAVRRRQDKIDLSFLQQRSRREAREYLESLEGVDKTTAASVVLFSLGGHAIPVDDLILYVLRQEELVDPAADLPTVQSFLERSILAEDAAAFSILLSRYAAQKAGRIPIERLRQLLSPPPPPPAPPPVTKPPPGPAGKDGKQNSKCQKPGKPAKAAKPSAVPGAARTKKK
ncbi:MAG TPA: hypothetical protein PKG54_07550 [Phycisphaerae bacterium]|jgi:endonuclease III|nr:hypothetical protein [Phycisphaerae bacterium]HOJ54517.1 hypothetical protein [Phycisphaerae bacterium]HOL26546.1 hypothetical protein [Phycisphaerae bacterium]HPP20945.1 hypothetical protein [Phycisphaerae bacterium]HPU33178.1 hypothetical protein [Phycisphaerae bacterium]